jgi:glutamine amidotransferase
VERLRATGLADLLTRLIRDEGKPFLGICLGMQLICRESYEHGHHAGLGWVDATVRRISARDTTLRVPHIGWNDVEGRPDSSVLSGRGVFYFVHSYYVDCDHPEDVAASCRYGVEFAACLEHENIVATQFHPEKSQTDGLALLRRFLTWDPDLR